MDNIMTLRKPQLPSRRSVRLQGYNYRQKGAYFVTICAYQKSCLFGQIRDGGMVVNDLGMVINECWQQISQVRRGVETDAFVVMPNHIHGIIFKLDVEPVDSAAQSFRENRLSASISRSASLGVIVGQFKRAVAIRSRALAIQPKQPVWQRSFYEHIIRNERSLDDIRKYIVENPARWHDDSLYVN